MKIKAWLSSSHQEILLQKQALDLKQNATADAPRYCLEIFCQNNFFMECRNSDQIKQLTESVSCPQKASFSFSVTEKDLIFQLVPFLAAPAQGIRHRGWTEAG